MHIAGAFILNYLYCIQDIPLLVPACPGNQTLWPCTLSLEGSNYQNNYPLYNSLSIHHTAKCVVSRE